MKDITITPSAEKTAQICDFNIHHQREGLLIYRPDEMCVLISSSDPMDKEFLEANGIKTVRLGNAGGCIVAFPENIEVGHFSKDIDNTFLERLTYEVMAFLKDRGLDVTRNNNDVLIDNTYKVFSTSKATYDKAILFGAIHVSINCDAELIDQICTKPMKKIPKGLSEYGITSDEMLDLIVRLYEQE